MTTTASPGPNYEKYKECPWYRHNVGEIDPAVSKAFEQRGIPPSDLARHVEQVHHKAFEMHPWPLIGAYNFLQTEINKQEVFPSILLRLQRGDATILDLGCGLGQDVRALIDAGVPSQNIYALDYLQDFWDVGLELFNDAIGTGRGMEDVTFQRQDFLRESIPQGWKGKMDIIFAGAFLHIFDYQDQLSVCLNAAKLLKAQPSSLIFGYQFGSTTAGEKPLAMAVSKSGNNFLHDRKSFEQMWQDIGAELGVQFNTHTTLTAEGFESFKTSDDKMGMMHFVVEVVCHTVTSPVFE